MSTMLYREGKGTQVWGKEFQTKVVKDEAIAEHLADGWHMHPDEVAAKKVEKEPNKRARKNKVESDEQFESGEVREEE